MRWWALNGFKLKYWLLILLSKLLHFPFCRPHYRTYVQQTLQISWNCFYICRASMSTNQIMKGIQRCILQHKQVCIDFLITFINPHVLIYMLWFILFDWRHKKLHTLCIVSIKMINMCNTLDYWSICLRLHSNYFFYF
jgi:hypothetical protein